MVNSDEADVNQILSNALKRDVTLDSISPGPRTATAEEYWLDIGGLDHRDAVTELGLPEGTFFDAAVVHLLTPAIPSGWSSARVTFSFVVQR